ncbi:MAG: TonB-dependent receptor [Bacteroidales bacterium]|jgi:TonB-linked SusC/RagA family outer membrane protein|nr:TonB-dependent receptor [Bacteroidales bacterium]
MRYKLLILLICLPFVWTNASGNLQAQQQEKLVSGTITDDEGLPLPGVNIFVRETTIGTTSDFDGNYEIAIPANISNPVLVFRFVGFLEQEIPVGTKALINVSLKSDVQLLEEMVVVGYEIRRKADLIGAVSSIKMDELNALPVSSVDQALQGRASGVNITSNTGMPGEGVKIRIRGVGSINSSNEPLYIVDGIPTANALDVLHPNDIESVDILKDASSTAIYGSRANNGVVLITTRKGVKGKPRIDFSSQVGFQQHGKLTEMANTAQYVDIYNEAARNDNAFIENPRLQRKYIEPDFAATLPDVDQLGAIFRNGFIQNQNLSVSGGDEKLTYLISGNYFSQEGIIIGSDYERMSGKVSLSSKLSDVIKIGTNINISKSDNNRIGSSGDGFGGNGGSVVRYAMFRTPAIPIRDANGNFVDLPERQDLLGDGYNPVGLATYMSDNIGEKRLFGDVNLQAKIMPTLIFTSTFGGDVLIRQARRFDRNWGTNNRINNPNRLTIADGTDQNWTWSNVLSYTKLFGEKHDFSAILGSEAIQGTGYYHSSTQQDFPDQTDILVFLGNGLGNTMVNEDRWGYSLLSFFGKANYTYNGKYLLSGTLRRDGSSRFSTDNRWGTFYSFSAGWRLDREAFLAEADQINMLKLRVGYGAIGNQEVGNYAYSDQVGYNFDYPFGDVLSRGYAITVLGNQNLQWETSEQFNIGLDLGLWEDKFTATLDFYNKINSNMLVREPIPPSAGYAEPAWVNKGKILNRGMDLELNYRNTFGEFFVEVGGNLGFLHNEVLELPSPILNGRIDNGVYATRSEVGSPVGSFYLYEMDGIFQDELEIFTSAYQGVNVRPGDVKYVDQNGDGLIDEKDRKHVGSAIPKFTAGLNLAAAYKQFDLGMFFQAATGHHIYYQVATDIEGFYRPFNVTQRYYDEHWTGPGTSNTQPRASWASKANNTRPSTRFLEDGSYVRLKNIQLGYTFNTDATARLGIKKLRIYVNAYNLLTFTKYPGLDPEMTTSNNSAGEGDAAAGIDWGTYPVARSYNFGVQLSF